MRAGVLVDLELDPVAVTASVVGALGHIDTLAGGGDRILSCLFKRSSDVFPHTFSATDTDAAATFVSAKCQRLAVDFARRSSDDSGARAALKLSAAP
jgi:hypothetical protein